MLFSVRNYKIWSYLGTMTCTQQGQKATAGMQAAWQLTVSNLTKSILMQNKHLFFSELLNILVDETKIWWSG